MHEGDATRPESVVIRPEFDPCARPFHTITEEQWGSAWEAPMREVIAQMQAAFYAGARRIVIVVPTTAMSGGSCYAHVAAPAEGIRLLGEDVWEFDTAESAVFRLDPADVLTAQQAGELLDPFIKPLPAFDDGLLPR